MPGQSQGAGAQTQIASRQHIPQGKGPRPACCLSQGRTSPVSSSHWLVWRVYHSSVAALIHGGPACASTVHKSKQAFSIWSKDEGRVGQPKRSIESFGLLVNHGRSHPSVWNTLHWHVRWQAHWQALDRRQSQDIASDIAFSAPRPYSSRGMQNLYVEI